MNTPTTNAQTRDAKAVVGEEVVRRIQNDEGVGDLFGYQESDYADHESVLYRLYRRSRYEEAEQIARGLLELDPKRPYAYLILGDLKLRDNEVDEAVPYFLSGLTFAPNSSVFQMKLAECYLRGGNDGGAVKLLTNVLSSSETSQAQRRRAQALLKVAKSG